MPEQDSSVNRERNSPAELAEERRQKMLALMDRLEARRQETGIVTIKGRRNEKEKKILIFPASIDSIEENEQDKTRKSKDTVVVTEMGVYRIRHYLGTDEGDKAFEKFNNLITSMSNQLLFGNQGDTRDISRMFDISPAEEKPGASPSLWFNNPYASGDLSKEEFRFSQDGERINGVLVSTYDVATEKLASEAYDESVRRAIDARSPSAQEIKQAFLDSNALNIANSLLNKMGESQPPPNN